MFVTGKATFLEARELKDKGITFGVFGFEEDFDRREFLVPTDLASMLPKAKNQICNIKMQILKRFDGKEDLRLVECKAV